MANAAYWFKHDTNAKDDYKSMLLIDQLGLEGYGIYWVLIETLREQEGYRYPMAMLPILAKRYGTSGEKMRAVVSSYGLFEIFEDDSFTSPALVRRMDEYESLCQKRRAIGAAGGRKKAENRTKNLLSDNQEPTKALPNGNQTSTKPVPNRRDGTGVELNRKELTGRDDKDEYRKVGFHSVSVGVVRSFLDEGYSQSEVDDVLDGISVYAGLDQVQKIGGLISSWLKKRKDKPRRTPGSKDHDPRYRLYTHSEVDKGQMWKDVSIVRIEGLSACRSANGNVLWALITDIEKYGLIRREPKGIGLDWPD